MKNLLIICVLFLAACSGKNQETGIDAVQENEPYATCVNVMGISPNDVNRISSCINYLSSNGTAQIRQEQKSGRLNLKEAAIPNANAKIQQRQAQVPFYNQGITKTLTRTPEEQLKVDTINSDPNCKTTFINGIEVKRCVGYSGNTICYFKNQETQTDFTCTPESDYMKEYL